MVEPLVIPMIMLEQGTKAVNYKAKLKDIKVFGLSEYKFQTINVQLDKLLLTGKVDFNRVHLVSDYDIKGRALVLPVEGNGIFKANLTQVMADIIVQCSLVKRKGMEYLDIKDVSVKLNVGGAMANFGNLFNGDPTLSQTTNAFLNENAKDIIDEIKPAVEAVVGMLIDDILSKFFKTTPYDKLFIP
uniref:Lipid-binding serum glycoprotein N-terminal domain-containing protein n=1 Tax=Clastoptera arizonana TaxID=38151 RepID=A0A1B6C2E4_9HEMI